MGHRIPKPPRSCLRERTRADRFQRQRVRVVPPTAGSKTIARTRAARIRTGAELVEYVAINYSISPRLLLALLEYQSGALTQPEPPNEKYLLGFRRAFYDSPYLQLVIAANILNNGYYGWRSGNARPNLN
jgi:hypothetical protein